MAPFILCGATPLRAAFVVNWLSLIVIGWIAWLLMVAMAGRDDWRVRLGAVLAMANPAQAKFACLVLTETMFTALALLLVWVCYKLGEAER
jgi:hypothetical protein